MFTDWNNLLNECSEHVKTQGEICLWLCRLRPRASRSKGAPTNRGTHRVNGQYIISQIKLRLKLMSELLFTKFSFIQLPCDNARVFQRVSMNLNMTVGQAVCQLLCRYTQSTLAASCVCWIVPIVTCTLSKELVGVHVRNAPDQWYNWRTAPCQAKC